MRSTRCPECGRERPPILLAIVYQMDGEPRRVISARGELVEFSCPPPADLIFESAAIAFRPPSEHFVTVRCAQDPCTCSEVVINTTIPAHHVWRESAYQGA